MASIRKPAFPLRRPAWAESRRRAWATTALALLGCALMIAAAADFRPSAPSSLLDDGLGWMTLGVLVFGAALWQARRPILPTFAPTTAPLNPARARRRWIVAGAALLAVVAEISGRRLGIVAPGRIPATAQFLLLCAGLALVAWGFCGGVRFGRLDWKRLLPLAAILALALALRLVALDNSIRTLVDETHWINGIERIWWHPEDGLLTAGSTYLPTTLVYSYWQASAIALVGRTLFGLRVTSALVGTLNVLALYLLARALFDRWTALAAAFLLATFPPHVHFSRIAMAHVADTLFGTLALAFAARGLRANRRADWALCGVSLGLTQYFYEGGRLLFPPLVAVWLALLIVVARGHLRAQWRGIVVAAAAALIVAAPVYYVIAAKGNSATNRMDDAGLGARYWGNLLADGLSPQERADLIYRVTLPFEIYVHQGELAVYYGGGQALILAVFVPLALLGVAFIVWRWRTPAVILPLWVAATAVGNMFLRDGGQFPRYVVVFPALALLMTLGARSALALLMARAPRFARDAVLAALIAGVGAAQVGYYFLLHLPVYNVEVRAVKPYPDGTDAVLRAVSLPRRTQIVMISDPAIDYNVPRTLYGYLIDPPRDLPLLTYSRAEITPELVAGLARDRGYAFFVQPGDDATVRTLRTYLPLDAPKATDVSAVPPDKRLLLYFSPQPVAP